MTPFTLSYPDSVYISFITRLSHKPFVADQGFGQPLANAPKFGLASSKVLLTTAKESITGADSKKQLTLALSGQEPPSALSKKTLLDSSTYIRKYLSVISNVKDLIALKKGEGKAGKGEICETGGSFWSASALHVALDLRPRHLWTLFPVNDHEFYIEHNPSCALPERFYLSHNIASNHITLTQEQSKATVFTVRVGYAGTILGTTLKNIFFGINEETPDTAPFFETETFSNEEPGFLASSLLNLKNERHFSLPGRVQAQPASAFFVPSERSMISMFSYDHDRSCGLLCESCCPEIHDPSLGYFLKPLSKKKHNVSLEIQQLLVSSLLKYPMPQDRKKRGGGDYTRIRVWRAKQNIRVGTVLATEQHNLFDLMIHSSEKRKKHPPRDQNQKNYYEGNITDVGARKGTSIFCPQSSADFEPPEANVYLSTFFLGHPFRQFPYRLIFAVREIEKGEEVILGHNFPPLPQEIAEREPFTPCDRWPQGEAYYHGVGRHTCGPAVLPFPLNQVRITPCPSLGKGEFGLLAISDLLPGVLFPYGGCVSSNTSPYAWATNTGSHIVGGNIMRYANTYHGIAPRSNATLLDTFVIHEDGSKTSLPGIALTVPVIAGQPILVHSYGRDADFEVLRKTICKGQYLRLADFPPSMLLPCMASMDYWYLPGDLVITCPNVEFNVSSNTLRVYSIHEIYENAIARVSSLRRIGPLVYALCRGAPSKSMKLSRAILLIPDEDYELEEEDKKKKFLPKEICSPKDDFAAANSLKRSTTRLRINRLRSPKTNWNCVSPGSQSQTRGPIEEADLEDCLEFTEEEKNFGTTGREMRKRIILTVRLRQTAALQLQNSLNNISEQPERGGKEKVEGQPKASKEEWVSGKKLLDPISLRKTPSYLEKDTSVYTKQEEMALDLDAASHVGNHETSSLTFSVDHRSSTLECPHHTASMSFGRMNPTSAQTPVPQTLSRKILTSDVKKKKRERENPFRDPPVSRNPGNRFRVPCDGECDK